MSQAATTQSRIEKSGDPGWPPISVIILNYNGARWLERCLESLRKQTIFDQLEIIVRTRSIEEHLNLSGLSEANLELGGGDPIWRIQSSGATISR